jgi:hypothetical protein
MVKQGLMIINIFGSVQNAGTKIAFQVLTYTSLKMTTEIKNRMMPKTFNFGYITQEERRKTTDANAS